MIKFVLLGLLPIALAAPYGSSYGDSNGYGNSGYGNSGYGNSGYGNSGYDNSGYGNSGYGKNDNSDYGNSGYGNSGYGNSGYGYSDKYEKSYPPQPYKFGYDIKDHYGSNLQQQEEGDSHGNKKGSYAFTDGHGIQRIVEYVADKNGFRANIKTNEPGTSSEDPADVHIESNAPKVEYHSAPQKYKSYSEPSYSAPTYKSYSAPSYGGDSYSNSNSYSNRGYERRGY